MASLVKNEPQVANYFRDAVLEIVDPNALKQVVDEFDASDFRKLGPDVKGDVFEYLLTHLGQSALNRQFRTAPPSPPDPDLHGRDGRPRARRHRLRPRLRRRRLPDRHGGLRARTLQRGPEEIPIYARTGWSGAGQTLEEMRKEIPSLQTYRKGPSEKIPDWRRLEASIHGADVSRQMMRISMMNLGAPRDPPRESQAGEHPLRDERTHRGRPPPALPGDPLEPALHRPGPRGVDPAGLADSIEEERAALPRPDAPLARARRPLHSRCTEGALFGSTKAHKDLRERLLRECELLAVVSLPAGVFKPYAGVKTSVLVFRRPATGSRRGPGGDEARLVLRDPERRLRPRRDPGRRPSRDTG